jgi:hypothetical protein
MPLHTLNLGSDTTALAAAIAQLQANETADDAAVAALATAIANLPAPSASYDASWLPQTGWYDSVTMPVSSRYTRILEGEFTAFTSLALEYRDNAGVVHPFFLNNFTTDFEQNGFWNTATGTARVIPVGTAQVMVAVVLEGRSLSLCVQDGAFGSADPKRMLQFRNVKINGYPADRLGDAAIQEILSSLKVLRMDTDANTEAIGAQMMAATTVTPVLSNMAVNKALTTSYWPTKSGVTRTGSVSRPPANVSDFYMADANYDGELELPLSNKPGQVLGVRNEATYSFTLRSLNTNLSAAVTIPNSRSIHFVADATGKWHWILAGFATK